MGMNVDQAWHDQLVRRVEREGAARRDTGSNRRDPPAGDRNVADRAHPLRGIDNPPPLDDEVVGCVGRLRHA